MAVRRADSLLIKRNHTTPAHRVVDERLGNTSSSGWKTRPSSRERAHSNDPVALQFKANSLGAPLRETVEAALHHAQYTLDPVRVTVPGDAIIPAVDLQVHPSGELNVPAWQHEPLPTVLPKLASLAADLQRAVDIPNMEANAEPESYAAQAVMKPNGEVHIDLRGGAFCFGVLKDALRMANELDRPVSVEAKTITPLVDWLVARPGQPATAEVRGATTADPVGLVDVAGLIREWVPDLATVTLTGPTLPPGDVSFDLAREHVVYAPAAHLDEAQARVAAQSLITAGPVELSMPHLSSGTLIEYQPPAHVKARFEAQQLNQPVPIPGTHAVALPTGEFEYTLQAGETVGTALAFLRERKLTQLRVVLDASTGQSIELVDRK